MKSIVVLGERYAKNLGDGVICRCVEDLVKKYAKPNDSIVCLDLSCRENYDIRCMTEKSTILQVYSRIINRLLSVSVVQRYFRKKMGELLYTYWCWERGDRLAVREVCMKYPADVVIFAGGELFKDYFLFYIKYFVKEYSRGRSQIFFNACGCDTNNSSYVTKRFRQILLHHSVRRITTRNYPESCAALIPSEKYIFMPDPAICAADFFPRNKDKEAYIGLGIMAIDELDEKRNELLAFWTDIIYLLETNGISYKLFCNGATEDYQFAQEIVRYLHLDENKLLSKPVTPEELIMQITSFDKICAFRMHSIIISYAYQIPFVGFGWDKKITDFSRYIGQENQILDWERTSAASVLQLLDRYSVIPGRLSELKEQIHLEFQNEILGVQPS